MCSLLYTRHTLVQGRWAPLYLLPLPFPSLLSPSPESSSACKRSATMWISSTLSLFLLYIVIIVLLYYYFMLLISYYTELIKLNDGNGLRKKHGPSRVWHYLGLQASSGGSVPSRLGSGWYSTADAPVRRVGLGVPGLVPLEVRPRRAGRGCRPGASS